jgi:peptidoglycan/xylan/chitin deacetylase (PgdA/CDA1 family)
MRDRGSQLAFGLPVAVAVSISLVFALRGNAAPAPAPKRFSGSSVVSGMRPLLPNARLPRGFSVAIVRDHEAASFYDSAATLDTIIGAWRRALESAGASVRVVRPGEVRGSGARVVLVPSSPCLSLDTREAIDMAGSRGQGLIISGLTGSHDAGCRQLGGGYGLVVGLTNASRAGEIAKRPVVYARIPALSPLSADIPPGARLDLGPARQVALRVPERDAFYSDFRFAANPIEGEPSLDAAVVRSSYRGARLVYFGFEPRHLERGAFGADVMRLLVRNAAAWAAGVPRATVAPWPRGRPWAAVIAQDGEARFSYARHALDSLQDIGVRGTYFLTSDIAREEHRLTRAMAAFGEVATHSENHDLLGGTPFERQLARLQITRLDLYELTDSAVVGLRPPEEQFDSATMRAWVEAGGRYLLGSNDSRGAAPELLRLGSDTLVLVPRAFADDFEATGPKYRRAPHLVTAVMRADAARAKAVGGLYVLSYHSQLLSRPEYTGVLGAMARQLVNDKDVWLATAAEVADWWRRRAAVSAEVTRVTDEELVLLVRNRGEAALDDVVISTTLPPGRRAVGARNITPTDGGATIALPRVPALARISVVVRLR